MRPVDLLSLTGNLYWYRHDKQPDGTSRWTDRKVVGTGWHGYVSVCATGNFIYAVDPQGNLYWYRHDGQQDGTKQWTGRKLVDTGWQSYVSIFATGKFIYAVDSDGKVYWYRHDGQQDGTKQWTGRKLVKDTRVSAGTFKFVPVFAVGNIIFGREHTSDNWALTRHDGQQDGTERWTGWAVFVSYGNDTVSRFAESDMLYDIASDGNLYGRQIAVQQTGIPLSMSPGRKVISNDNWMTYKSVFAADNGVIYGLGVDTMSWMSLIQLDRKLNEFTIPGTHDTGTWPLGDGNAKCQTLTLKEQLEAGIRFIDIRVVQSTHNGKPDFQIYHGMVNTGLWFSTDIVPVCKQFLHAHPTETIIMSVKDESGSTDDFETHLKLYLTPDICLSNPAIPTLAEARGKIVLFRRYEYETTGTPATMGIPAHRDWPPDERGFDINTGHNILHIQDVYGYSLAGQIHNEENKKEKLDKKWSFVEEFLNKAASETDNNAWWINFASASGFPGTLNPMEFAVGAWGHKGINLTMTEYLETHKVGHFGLVVMDFPEYPNHGNLIQRLICTNVRG